MVRNSGTDTRERRGQGDGVEPFGDAPVTVAGVVVGGHGRLFFCRRRFCCCRPRILEPVFVGFVGQKVGE